MNTQYFEIDTNLYRSLARNWLYKQPAMKVVLAICTVITLLSILTAISVFLYLYSPSSTELMITVMALVMGLFFGMLVFLIGVVVYKVAVSRIGGQLYYSVNLFTPPMRLILDDNNLSIVSHPCLDRSFPESLGTYSFPYSAIHSVSYDPKSKLVTVNGEGVYYLREPSWQYTKWACNRFFAAFPEDTEEKFFETLRQKGLFVSYDSLA